MKLPSLQKIVQDSRRTFSRFPLALACGLLGTAAALILTDREGPDRASVLYNALFAFTLGFPLLVTIPLVAKKWSWSNLQLFGVQAISVFALVIYAASIPSDIPHAPLVHLYRHLLLTLGLILLVLFANYIGSGQQNGFWQFNKTLFFRLLTAALFAIVLFLGLSIALAAMDKLFGMDVPGKRYGELWIAILGFFAPLFFLSGIPEDLDDLDTSDDYPKGLRVFAQYILAPLVIVYLVILYAYIAKIISQWSWPQGWVSRLVLSFSATGIFSLALLYPIREQIENRWVKSAIRWFWIVIIPMIIVLLLAIWQRISDYGITESRYIGVVLAAWLAVMALYFNLSKTKGLKIIPASLCLLVLAISFGPWGIFHVSEQSQIKRLQEMLISNKLLVNNRLISSSDTVRTDDSRQISSIITYLYDTHGYSQIQQWFNQSLAIDSAGTSGMRKEPEEVAKLIGIKYYATPRNLGDSWAEFASDRRRAVAIAGFQHLILDQYIRPDERGQKFAADGFSYIVDTSLWVMTFVNMTDSAVAESLEVNLHPLIDTLIAEYGPGGGEDILPPKMSISVIGATLKIEVCLKRIHLQRKKDVLTPTFYSADILYSTEK